MARPAPRQSRGLAVVLCTVVEPFSQREGVATPVGWGAEEPSRYPVLGAPLARTPSSVWTALEVGIFAWVGWAVGHRSPVQPVRVQVRGGDL